jgi:predicted urease superfamily metal-dependent hydrolase
MFYYVTRILKNANEIAEEFRSRLQILTEAINYVRGKVENIHSLLNVAGNGMAGVVKDMVSKKAKDWANKGSNKMNAAAKEAVAKAVEATAKKMKKAAKNFKK